MNCRKTSDSCIFVRYKLHIADLLVLGFLQKRKKNHPLRVILNPFQSLYAVLLAEMGRQSSVLFEFAQQCFNNPSSSINSRWLHTLQGNSHRKSGNVQLTSRN